jgi:Protein of unknown function DUF2625
MVSGAGDRVRVLPVEERLGQNILFRLQVTVASVLGALAAYTSGVVIDHGCRRVLGGGGLDCQVSPKRTASGCPPRTPHHRHG